MELTKRPATEKDKKFIYSLNRAAYQDVVTRQFGEWNEDWQRDYFEKKWERANYQIIMKDGFAIGVIWVTGKNDHIALNEIQLLPEFQDKGIGSTLMLRELENAREKNLPIRLRMLKENRARSLYERLGFILYDETDVHFFLEKTV